VVAGSVVATPLVTGTVVPGTLVATPVVAGTVVTSDVVVSAVVDTPGVLVVTADSELPHDAATRVSAATKTTVDQGRML
jgi:hypothetical protein